MDANIVGRARQQVVAFDFALQRARADFLEIPGLHLTAFQAQRLWTLDADVCDSVLRRLIEIRFLARTTSNTFTRATS